VQAHTADIVNCSGAATTITTSAPTQIRKCEIGKWEAGSLIEPLQITLPVTTSATIKAEIHSGSSTSSTSSVSSKTPSSSTTARKSSTKSTKSNKNINECILNLHQQHQTKITPCEITKVEPLTPTTTGCSRTLPLTWSQAFHQLQTLNPGHYAHQSTDHLPTTHLLQIKREPCQVSEVTTSNNLIATTSFSGAPALIKIEQKSPTTTTSSSLSTVPVTSTSNMEIQTQQNSQNIGLQNNSNREFF
jgi:hypothetical protein